MESNTQEYKCPFCKRSFYKEKTLLSHMCEQKRRFNQKNEKYVQIGFLTYQEFYKQKMGGKEVNYEKFSKSKLYSAFVRFGRYILEIDAINMLSFINYLIKNEIAIEQWEKTDIYDSYKKHLLINEPPLDALERSFLLMQNWALNNNENWIDFYKKVAPAQAVLWIQSGKISPWIWILLKSSIDLLTRMNEEQIYMIEKYMDINQNIWQQKIKLYSNDIKYIQEELEKIGI